MDPFFAVSNSIFAHHEKGSVHLHIIAPDLSASQRDQVKEYAEQHGSISFYTIDRNLVNGFVLSGKWTASVYYRLFFPKVLPAHIGKFLYLDCDTIVMCNLASFFSIEMSSYPVAAVYDNYVKVQPHIGIMNEGEYFNSGVLLVDVARWNELKISERAIDYLLVHPENIRFVDQCALNAVLKNNWKKLSCHYNLIYTYVPQGLSQRATDRFASESFIIHFTLERPWRMLCKSRLRKLYKHHLKLAGRKFRYSDFAWKNMVAFVKIRLVEVYLNFPVLQRMWRTLKPGTHSL